MLSSEEIRSKFIEFFQGKGHTFVPSSPVVPNDDPTLLFTNAGMNQFKDIFLGMKAKKCDSAANSQKCIRVSGKHNDLEEVGVDTYHHTFFEMLGNWSFDSYFKEDTIKWAWELLTEVYKIDPDKLWATVFAGDETDGSEYDAEAARLWPQLTGIPKERVLACGKKDNFWEMGDTGPCGPCSEIHIDLGPEMCDMQHVEGHKCAVNAGCARFIELWNLVFIQFNRVADGSLMPLKAKYVDTGAGLERICAVLQGKKSNYDTDLFMPIINGIENLSGVKYTSSLKSKSDIAMRVIADHLRSLSFAITDGASPGNDGRGYVLRRILRRACRFGRVLNMHEPFIYKLVPALVDKMGGAFPELKARSSHVQTVIQAEEASFGRTLDRGLEMFTQAAEKAQDGTIRGEDAFQLYDTYGFPLDLTSLMARERGLSVDTDAFEELMEQQRNRARAAQKSNSMLSVLVGIDLPETDDSLKYSSTDIKAKIIASVCDDGYTDSGTVTTSGDKASLILDKTCFYAESGGQIGDAGMITSDTGRFIVDKTTAMGHCVLHEGRVIEGSFEIGQDVYAMVSPDREATRKNHTATHILQWALREVLGDSVSQQGSLVNSEYLRFDFTWPKALSPEELHQVEKLVNMRIGMELPVQVAVMPIEEAKELGATALFGEKYGDTVRVISIGAASPERLHEGFSLEFCGGTHIDNIGRIGGFKVVREESISAGVRRITAVTGPAYNKYMEERSGIVDELTALLKVPAEQVSERVAKLIADNKELSKKLKTAHKQGGSDVMQDAKKLLETAAEFAGSKAVVGELADAKPDDMRSAMDMLKKKAPSSVIFLASAVDGKVMMIAGVTDDLVKKGIKAGELVRELAPIVGGGGGGRPQMAQAGGKNPEKLDECLKKAKETIAAKLS
ncbi:Alanine--tRNA ligase [Limihaloglobus sulfuriphilus]|uniref:Alanine--tRNA ligase n=1 Tax=Limihaloglobus sulfuriphilus TaxID=1851148 RepID=A0A1Q2MAH7_9BACT|nr:alanine--tRNA ligase [Limihaloglobus sulfuriphilus]AQQ69691.1 Alanine--tRNA ligase [Limihaloglobus sulfuriphilus]